MAACLAGGGSDLISDLVAAPSMEDDKERFARSCPKAVLHEADKAAADRADDAFALAAAIVKATADAAALAAEEAAAAASAASDVANCVVRESYDKSATFYSSLHGETFHHPELDNKLGYPCWAAATLDTNQVSLRTLLPLLQ